MYGLLCAWIHILIPCGLPAGLCLEFAMRKQRVHHFYITQMCNFAARCFGIKDPTDRAECCTINTWRIMLHFVKLPIEIWLCFRKSACRSWQYWNIIFPLLSWRSACMRHYVSAVGAKEWGKGQWGTGNSGEQSVTWALGGLASHDASIQPCMDIKKTEVLHCLCSLDIPRDK